MNSFIALACLVTVVFAQDCADQHTQCGQWASTGDCDKNPFFMKVQCQKACNSCGCTIRDAATCGGSTGGQQQPTEEGPVGAPSTPTGGAAPMTPGSHGMGSPPANPTPVKMTVNTPAPPTATDAPSTTAAPATTAPPASTAAPAATDAPATTAAQAADATTVSPAADATTVAATGECTNQLGDTDCCRWASSGECEKNPFFMKVQCAKSCGSCACTIRNANNCPSTVDAACSVAAEPTTAPTTAAAETTTAAAETTTAVEETTTATVEETTTVEETSETTVASADTTAAVTTQATATTTEDLLQFCSFWAFMGECEKNPTYMQQNCGTECASGKSTPTDGGSQTHGGCNSGCAGQGHHGKGKGHHGKGKGHHGKGKGKGHHGKGQGSAKTAGCVDKDELCAFWGSMGECEKNPTYMKANCGQSCKTC